MNNSSAIESMLNAVKGLKTVRLPYPTTIDELSLKRDQNQIASIVSEYFPVADEDFEERVKFIIGLQRLLFNRGLEYISSNSLADMIVVAFPAGYFPREEQALFMGISDLLIQILENKQLIDEPNASDNFFAQLNERVPQLVKDAQMDSNASAEAADVSPHQGALAKMIQDNFLNNHPVEIFSNSMTPFIAQNPEVPANFNEFIMAVKSKNSPAQLQATYALFNPNETYMKILTALQRAQFGFGEENVRANLYFVWWQLPALNIEAIIVSLKIYHQFLKFCMDQQLLTAKEYAKLLKLGNQAAIARVIPEITEPLLEVRGTQQSVEIADRIFTNPNYTINVTNARKELSQLGLKPKSVYQRMHTNPLKLSKKLDQHQLALELKRAEKYLAHYEMGISEVDFTDLPLYHDFVLKMHSEMVTHYNRRLSRWTMESLEDCLTRLFKSNTKLYSRPTIFRYLQDYFFALEEEGAVKNVDALLTALDRSFDDYLIVSLNGLVAK